MSMIGMVGVRSGHRPPRQGGRGIQLRLIAAVLILTQPVYAQHDESTAPADSAAVARAAWGRAVQASRAGDLRAALQQLDRAVLAWPTQPAYQWARARIAAQAGDSAAVLAALRAYADLGLGRDLRTDTLFAPYRPLPAFEAAAAAHDRHRAPLVRGRVIARLPDSTFWPEGMDHDPRTGNFYVTSIRHRTVAEVAPSGAVRELLPRHQPGIGAVLGVRVDTARRVLWITTSGLPQMQEYALADSAIAGLIRLRPDDGAIERRWDLPPASGGHVLGDLAVGPEGDVYVTNSSQPVLYILKSGGDSLWPVRHQLFRSLQGVAPAPDGRALYLADYSHGLLRLDLATRRVIRVEDAPNSTSLGCDGLAWYRNALLCVQNGVAPARIMRFLLDSTGARIVRAEVLDRNLPVADEPTIGAVVGDSFVYVGNSQWEKHDEHGRRTGATPLVPPVLIQVDLPGQTR